MPSRQHILGSLAIIAILILACSSLVAPAGAQGAAANARAIGPVGQLTGSCPDVTFVLSGVTVHATAATKFENGTCADLKDGVQTGAMGTKRADGSIDATRVRLGVTAAAPAPPAPRAQGPVAGLTGTCPALSFKLADTAVTTNDKTRFVGGKCEDVKEGLRIGATGPKDASGTMAAATVRVGPATPTAAGRLAAPGAPTAETRVQGVVVSMTGTCPALTFTVGNTTVHTTDKTRFEGGQCSDVKDGVRAGIAGPRADDGSITATMARLAPGK
jgi:hypothetical protein